MVDVFLLAFSGFGTKKASLLTPVQIVRKTLRTGLRHRHCLDRYPTDRAGNGQRIGLPV